MPFLQTECVTGATSTLCTYTQVAPLITSDISVTIGIAVIIALMVASFLRYVFYR